MVDSVDGEAAQLPLGTRCRGSAAAEACLPRGSAAVASREAAQLPRHERQRSCLCLGHVSRPKLAASERRASSASCQRDAGDVLMTPVSKRAHVIMEVLSEALRVMSLLLLKLVQVLLMKALMVTELFSLSSPLTRTQTTMPHTHPCGA